MPDDIETVCSLVIPVNGRLKSDLDASARDPGVGNEITVIAPARSLDGYSVCELHGIVPIYKFSEDGSEDSHGSQNRHATRP